jgi:hypothetical protein
MKKLIIILLLIPLAAVYAQNNSNWQHIGPFSKNLAGGDLFETGRAECVAVDPSNSSKLYLGSFGGLWKTTNGGANWTSMEPNPMYYSGASAIAVSSTGAVCVASTELTQRITKGIYILTGTGWSALITLPPTQPYVINHLQFFPGSSTLLFACTSVGIFRSTNGGSSWAAISSATEEYENIVFIPGTNLCYATGGNKLNPASPKVFKESTDQGLSFSPVAAVTNLFTWTNVYADLCLGDVSTVNKEIFILAALNGGSPSTYKIFKMIKNTSTGAITCVDYYTATEYDIHTDRLAIAYTSNRKLFFGGVYITGLNVSTTPPSALSVSLMHTDQHDMGVIPSLNLVISASDGGFSTADYTTATTTFNRFNYGLDISQIHGFSGSATEPNFFVTGEQDTKGFVFTGNSNPNVGTTFQNWGTEPTGALIDKFNANRIFANENGLLNRSKYLISNDHGASFPNGGDPTHTNDNYLPITNQATFEASTNIDAGDPEFGVHTFYQDPIRPNKIYNAVHSLTQYDPLHNVFAIKMRPGVVFASDPDPKRCCSYQSQILSMAISTQDKNGFYFTTNKHSLGGPAGPTASQVIKFIGPDIDDTWMDYHELTANWQLITPDLRAAPFNYTAQQLPDADIYSITYTSCAISHIDKEKLWVGVSNNIPLLNGSGSPVVKVLFYNHGVWSDYSQGLNPDDQITSMVSERGSNDGIYLNTLRGVYYRNANAGMTSWVLYSTNFPRISSKQMEINYMDNTVRSGTYGQGVWRSPLSCPTVTADLVKASIVTPFEFTETKGRITSTAAVTPSGSVVYYRSGTQINLDPGFEVIPGASFDGFIHGCDASGSSFFRTAKEDDLMEEVIKKSQPQEEDFSIYPNPSDGSFTLTFPSMTEEEIEHGEEAENDVFIFDVMGKVILEKKQTTAKAITIDLSAYPKGIYLVRVVDEDGNSKVKKVVIE